VFEFENGEKRLASFSLFIPTTPVYMKFLKNFITLLACISAFTYFIFRLNGFSPTLMPDLALIVDLLIIIIVLLALIIYLIR
jgi:hypothetical protein